MNSNTHRYRPQHWAFCWPLILLLLGLSTRQALALINVQLIRDGPATDVKGYSGLSYQAIRYEPLCGNLGTTSQYTQSLNIGDKCTAAMDVFGNNTADAFGIYDLTGVRLKDGRVGNGYEVCLCFALSQPGTPSVKGALCLWVDRTGQTNYQYERAPISDYAYLSNYRPVDKALPLCKDVDLNKLKATWSATAVLQNSTEAVRTGEPAPTATSDSRHKGSRTPATVGGVIAAIVVVLIIGVCICGCCSSKSPSPKKEVVWVPFLR